MKSKPLRRSSMSNSNGRRRFRPCGCSDNWAGRRRGAGFLNSSAPSSHPAVRAHALVALLRCLREQEIRKDEYAKLFPILEEAESTEVTRLVIDLLDAHELPEDSRSLLGQTDAEPAFRRAKIRPAKNGRCRHAGDHAHLGRGIGRSRLSQARRRRQLAAQNSRSAQCADQRSRFVRRPEQSLEHRGTIAVLRREVAARYRSSAVETVASKRSTTKSGFRRRFCTFSRARTRSSSMTSLPSMAPSS